MSVEPGTYNFTLQRRADYNLILEFRDGGDQPLDLRGYDFYAQVWDAARTVKYADFEITRSNVPEGKIEISLTSAQTTIFPNQVNYDVLLKDPSERLNYYLEGVIFVAEGYTTPT